MKINKEKQANSKLNATNTFFPNQKENNSAVPTFFQQAPKNIVQREPKPAPSKEPKAAPATPTPQETASTAILTAAKTSSTSNLTTVQDAIKVIQLWGLSVSDIVSSMPTYNSATKEAVTGRLEQTSLETKAQQLVAALSTKGRTTYQNMMTKVKSEPFWKKHLANTKIFIYPDLSGNKVYNGFTQTATARTGDVVEKAFLIHINKDNLEKGLLDEAVAGLIHELSHTLHTNETQNLLKPLQGNLAEILVDEPSIKATRAAAPDQAVARQKQKAIIQQLIYEKTSYAEGEIFTHLQQLTHQPDVPQKGGTIRAHRYIFFVVEGYFKQLAKIGLPKAQLKQVVASLEKRTTEIYNQRIAELKKNKEATTDMERYKRMALLVFSINKSKLNL